MASPRLCSVADCDKPVHARGWCNTHYQEMRQRPRCSVPGCDSPVEAHGWCKLHHDRWRRHGNPLWQPRERMLHCSQVGCGRPTHARGLCSTHLARQRQGRDMLPPVREQGLAARRYLEELLARHHRPEDPCIIWPFRRDRDGYASQIKLNGRCVGVHRHICTLVHDEPPTPQHQAAHLCLNGHEGCCNPAHIYWATPAQNHADKLGRIRRMLGSSCPPGFWSAQPPGGSGITGRVDVRAQIRADYATESSPEN